MRSVFLLCCAFFWLFINFVILSPSRLCVSFTFSYYSTTILLPLFPFLLSSSNCSKAAVFEIEILTAGNIILYCCVCSLVTGGYIHLGGTTACLHVPERWDSLFLWKWPGYCCHDPEPAERIICSTIQQSTAETVAVERSKFCFVLCRHEMSL